MPIAKMKFIKNFAELKPKNERISVPLNTRGLYFLYKKNKNNDYSLLYVGKASKEKAGIRGRLNSHAKSKEWTHYSLFEMHDNISPEEIDELEGLFLHIYRYDPQANAFNCHRSYNKLSKLKNNDFKSW
jgi:hypothetical protein